MLLISMSAAAWGAAALPSSEAKAAIKRKIRKATHKVVRKPTIPPAIKIPDDIALAGKTLTHSFQTQDRFSVSHIYTSVSGLHMKLTAQVYQPMVKLVSGKPVYEPTEAYQSEVARCNSWQEIFENDSSFSFFYMTDEENKIVALVAPTLGDANRKTLHLGRYLPQAIVTFEYLLPEGSQPEEQAAFWTQQLAAFSFPTETVK